jgi:hypothetical protein
MTDGSYESHETKVKSCLNSAFAKAKLEKYVSGKYPKYLRMEVYSCREDIFSFFSDLFKPKS